ncbi:hypothetical protein [Listeria seeligeri]|uniref:hypothetical protein n=1 Tax=Listeria seeligeri TaxID=1640 RepID=UPI00162AB92F|nr:hypothetical protein [Listeria seeligeri]MBC1917026.1 hypothetical protein [Listeria seeligeri]MBC1990418.1 hypothetical protein [Listeria seeligeri]MBF2356064.1 hypothetical protein [Listeria seeligeri]
MAEKRVGSLMNREKKIPSVDDQVEIDRNLRQNNVISKPLYQKDEYTASDRKTLKVDPPVYDLVKSINQIEGGKIYKKVEEIVQFYIENKMTDRDRRIVRNISKRD